MLLRQLRFLDALAREGDVGRAASACRVSVASLATGLKELEKELGLVLLDRREHATELTQEGRSLLEWARGAISSMDGLAQEAALLREGLTGTIRLGVIPTASARLGTVLAPFLRDHPGVKVRAETLPARDAVAHILGRELDAALVYISESLGPGVKALPLYDETLVLVTSDPAWKSRRSTVTWEEAATLPLCLLSPSLQNRTMVDRAMRSAGVRVEPRVEADSVPALVDLGRSGYSCIVADRWLDDRELPEGTRVYRLAEPTISPTVGLITAQKLLVSPATRALRDYLAAGTGGGAAATGAPDGDAAATPAPVNT